MFIYRVKTGDTIYNIAKKYGITMGALLEANYVVLNEWDGNPLDFPRRLRIPRDGQPAPLPHQENLVMVTLFLDEIDLLLSACSNVEFDLRFCTDGNFVGEADKYDKLQEQLKGQVEYLTRRIEI